MTDEQRRQVIKNLGARYEDMDTLLEYTKNVFLPRRDTGGDNLSHKWPELWDKARELCDTPPRLEMFESAAGTIPIIYPGSEADFERLLREIVYKGKEAPDMSNVGAQFVFGKTLRFIILSNKPYSGVPAKWFQLDEETWMEKSLTIRKRHECAHYYTKRFLGSSRNNLHDELIADFCGLYAAFGEFHSNWFIKFFDMRAGIYTKALSETAAAVVRALASAAAKETEAWSKTEGFKCLDEAGWIEYLAGKELLEYGEDNILETMNEEDLNVVAGGGEKTSYAQDGRLYCTGVNCPRCSGKSVFARSAGSLKDPECVECTDVKCYGCSAVWSRIIIFPDGSCNFSR